MRGLFCWIDDVKRTREIQKKRKKKCTKWDSNPRMRTYNGLNVAPWTTRTSVLQKYCSLINHINNKIQTHLLFLFISLSFNNKTIPIKSQLKKSEKTQNNQQQSITSFQSTTTCPKHIPCRPYPPSYQLEYEYDPHHESRMIIWKIEKIYLDTNRITLGTL